MTPGRMMTFIERETGDWKYDRVSIGYPGPVIQDKPILDPQNLGKGWVSFPFRTAFCGKPLRIVNDAAIQALGSYNGGRMLYLGVGTGLGAAMVADGLVQAMELAHMPCKHGKTYEHYLGKAALKKHGRKKWEKHVLLVIEQLSEALESDYVVLGGGNASLIRQLPEKVVLGKNENAFKGAFMLWETGHKASR